MCGQGQRPGWLLHRTEQSIQINRPPGAVAPGGYVYSGIKENGKWGAKCRKAYNLDGQGQRQQIKTRAGKVKALKANAALFNFLQQNGISSMAQLYEKAKP